MGGNIDGMNCQCFVLGENGEVVCNDMDAVMKTTIRCHKRVSAAANVGITAVMDAAAKLIAKSNTATDLMHLMFMTVTDVPTDLKQLQFLDAKYTDVQMITLVFCVGKKDFKPCFLWKKQFPNFPLYVSFFVMNLIF
jgi:hypothetical protein